MTELQHKDGEQTASQVTVHYDNKIRNLEVDENGVVEVENKQEANELVESHGEFEKVSEDEPDHVLAGKTVNEVEKYVRDIEDVERLLELRELEDRKTGKETIDNRISEVKEQTPTDVEAEEVEQEDENQEQDNESEDEDGTENEE
jgi:vacuolar-type H+-ATPase subunit I/STV1